MERLSSATFWSTSCDHVEKISYSLYNQIYHFEGN
jgi:hypothetical protein